MSYNISTYDTSYYVINSPFEGGFTDFVLTPYNTSVLDALQQIQTILESLKLYSMVIMAILLMFGLFAIVWFNRRV